MSKRHECQDWHTYVNISPHDRLMTSTVRDFGSWTGDTTVVSLWFRLADGYKYIVLLNMAGTSYKIVVFAPAWSKNRHDTQTFYVCLMHNRRSWRTDKILHQNSGKLHIHAWFLPGMVYEKEAFLRAQQKEDLTKPVALSMTSGQSSPTGQCAGNLSIPSFFMTK
jgi:hypothetical protein